DDAAGRAQAAARRDGACAPPAADAGAAALQRPGRRDVSVVRAAARPAGARGSGRGAPRVGDDSHRRSLLRRSRRRSSAAHLLHGAAGVARAAGVEDHRPQRRGRGARGDGAASQRARRLTRRLAYNHAMRVVNRTAVTITGGEPYLEWMRQTDADFNQGTITVSTAKTYGSAFLLPEV